MGYSTITFEGGPPGVSTLMLNRPDRLNALTDTMFDEIARAFDVAAADPDLRAIVLTGAGRGFCSGLDLEEAAGLPLMSTTAFYTAQRRWGAAVARLRQTNIPIIAAVNGPAAGAGFSLALAADIRLVSPRAKFNAAFVRIGLSGGDCGISWALPRVVGLGIASELLFTGRFVEADEAVRLGLANRVVEEGDLMNAAYEMAGQIAANSPFGIRLTKELLQINVDAPSLEAALELENRSQVLATRTQDMVEALDAFRAKRGPVFGNA